MSRRDAGTVSPPTGRRPATGLQPPGGNRHYHRQARPGSPMTSNPLVLPDGNYPS